MKKIITHQLSGNNCWGFPFSKDKAEQRHIVICPEKIKWEMPPELLVSLPDSMEFYYVHIPNVGLFITSSVDDLKHLTHMLPVDSKETAERLVFPNTDNSLTRKTAWGLEMKPSIRNHALKTLMSRQQPTTPLPLIILCNRFLHVDPYV